MDKAASPLTLENAIGFSGNIIGKTHNFYHYPARFSPPFAKTIIETFSKKNDLVLDPYMGGGTSIVEGLSLGRRLVGVDINSLAHFVANARTTPLSADDISEVSKWVNETLSTEFSISDYKAYLPGIRNLPLSVERFSAKALKRLRLLEKPRQKVFARCALLRLGQWALDCRDFTAPYQSILRKKFPEIVDEMVQGLDNFVSECRNHGVDKNRVTKRRLLLNRSIIGLESDIRMKGHEKKFKLVVTSPPYPGVHVLYHRWQYLGRKETDAPYWIANVLDGAGETYYTLGGRSEIGLERYFQNTKDAFLSIKPFLASDCVVAQLIAFPKVDSQLPLYLESMAQAGYSEIFPLAKKKSRLERLVPNRKWYAKLKGKIGASSEILLFHRPCK